MTQNKLLVIGIGNPLRGDDGVGWFVAESLADRSDIDALPVHQLMPETAHSISQYSFVIFVDACIASDDIRFEKAYMVNDSAAIVHSHSMSPHDLLKMAFELFGAQPKAWIIRIPLTNVGPKHGLSDRSLWMAQRALEWINCQSSTYVEPKCR